MKEINEQDCIDSLKHSLKEIYNMALFDWDTMPEEGRKEFQKQVLKMVDEALNFGEQMERERDEAWEDLDEEMKFHHRTHGECVKAQCELMDVKNERDEAREKAERYRLEANAMMAKLHELQTYTDRLADGLPEGMLPRDVENLREANAGLAEDLQKAQQELNAATNRIAKFVSYWQSFCECECVSETPQVSCMLCDLQQLKASNIKNSLNTQHNPVE